MLAKYGHRRDLAEAIEAKYQVYRKGIAPRPKSLTQQATEFYTGEAKAVYELAKGTAEGTYSLVTKPVATMRSTARGIAGAIDMAIAAEDTPAYVQANRAANWVKNASAEELGHAVGTTAGNAFLAIAPEAIGAKFTTASRLGKLDPAAVPKGPPKITWVDEITTFTGPERVRAKAYNDSATGARSNPLTKKGQAPALDRTMPNGTTRKVKFDGVDRNSVYGDVLIDRKWSIRTTDKLKDQAIRQSKALAQHHLIGIWEIPTRAKARRATKLLKNLEISNIKVRITNP